MLSGGERKRVALASVLAWNPKILILDEPTIGQDYQQKEKLRQFIMQMKTQKKTTIIVTHDVEFVAECNPRVLLMQDGRIVADEEARKVLTNPEILTQASIVPPQVAQIFLQLSDLELPKNVIDIYEARETLIKILEKHTE
jgi:energy-coupling factor transport system ATP-binding protein